jgi:hypothetical protein
LNAAKWMTTRAGKDDKLERNPAKRNRRRNRKQKKRTQAANAHIAPIPPIPVDLWSIAPVTAEQR